MTIDTKRLETDAEYWDEVAPEGATHIDLDFGFFCNEAGFWNQSMEWRPLHDGHLEWGGSRYIPRPTKPAAPEWDGEGLPTVGSDQTVFVPATAVSAGGSDHPDSEWIMVAHHEGMGVVCIREFGKGKWRSSMVETRFCRPLRTKEQRQREELEGIVYGALNKNIYMEDCEEVIEAIPSHYNLEPKK